MSEAIIKPNPKDFGYTGGGFKYGWPTKLHLQQYRKAMSEYQKKIYAQSQSPDLLK